MKISVLAILLMSVVACNTNQQTIQESQRDAIIDSMVALRMEDITKQAAEDLDKRRAIEVKAKADSILTVRNGTALPENTHHSNNRAKP